MLIIKAISRTNIGPQPNYAPSGILLVSWFSRTHIILSKAHDLNTMVCVVLFSCRDGSLFILGVFLEIGYNSIGLLHMMMKLGLVLVVPFHSPVVLLGLRNNISHIFVLLGGVFLPVQRS